MACLLSVGLAPFPALSPPSGRGRRYATLALHVLAQLSGPAPKIGPSRFFVGEVLPPPTIDKPSRSSAHRSLLIASTAFNQGVPTPDTSRNSLGLSTFGAECCHCAGHWNRYSNLAPAAPWSGLDPSQTLRSGPGMLLDRFSAQTVDSGPISVHF